MSLTEDINIIVDKSNELVDIIDELKQSDIIFELDHYSTEFKEIAKQAARIEYQETIVRQKIHIMESLIEPQDDVDLKKYVTKQDIQKRNGIFFATRTNANKELDKLYDMVKYFENMIEKEYD